MIQLLKSAIKGASPLAWVAALALLGACDGENAFQPGAGLGGGSGASLVDIQEPRNRAGQPVGDSILVRARISVPTGLQSVEFRGFTVRGDPDLGTGEEVERFETKTVDLSARAPRDTVLARFLRATEDTERDSAFIVVSAIDPNDEVTADTVLVRLGAPQVELFNLENGGTRTPGLSLAIVAEARDPDGVNRLQVEITGAFSETIVRTANPAVSLLRIDDAVVIPSAARGTIQVRAVAINVNGIEGSSETVNLNIQAGSAADPNPPTLQFSTGSTVRHEVTDPLMVSVSAADDPQGSGLQRLGVTVLGISPTRNDTVAVTRDTIFAPPRTGTTTVTFLVNPFNVDLLSLPDSLIYEVTAFAIDQAGNCAAAVGDPQPTAIACQNGIGGGVRAQGRTGIRLNRVIVAGRTVVVPGGGRIMDAVVDTIRRNLLMSNQTRDRVEVFRVQEERFLNPIAVGSEPWGLAITRGVNEDTLLVANSGGTNISKVFLGPPLDSEPPFSGFEIAGDRILTPDVVLFDIERRRDDAGAIRFRVSHIPQTAGPGFSDRPQFVAVDSTRRVLYSTRTTPIGELGTIRKAYVPETKTRLEVRLFYEHGLLVDAADFFAAADVDGVAVAPGNIEDFIVFNDHVPGEFTPAVGGPAPIVDAFNQAVAAGSDMHLFGGRWNVPSIGFADTTFVAASGDGGWVAFGEGAVPGVGRVIMYDASFKEEHGLALSDVVQVSDLTNNASEVVRGLALNHDGTLGVARGTQAYFFSTDLRLQGVADLPAGGAGAALHPLHANYPTLAVQNPNQGYDPDTHLAFLGTGEGTIDIIDAFHFNRIGRLVVRDVVSGPLRAVLPFPEDNAGLQCQLKSVVNSTGEVIGQAVDIFADALGQVPYPATGGPTEDACIVLKLFAITTSGGVVVVDVRKSDILRDHPARL